MELSSTTAFPPAALFGSDSYPQQSFPPSQFGWSGGSGGGAAGVATSHSPGVGTQPTSGSLEAFFPPSGKASGQSSPVYSSLFSSSPAPSPTCVSASHSKLFPGVVHADNRPTQPIRWRPSPPPPSLVTPAPGPRTPMPGTRPTRPTSDDLLSFTDVKTADIKGRLGVEATKAQILQMYACSPSRGQVGARGLMGMQRPHSPLSRPVVPCGPQFCLPGTVGGLSAYSNSNLVCNNNHYGWVVQGVARQCSALGPRMASNPLACSGHSASACLGQPSPVASPATNASVSNANSLDLLQF